MHIKFGSVTSQSVESRVNLDIVHHLSFICSQTSSPTSMSLRSGRRRTIRINWISYFLTNSLESWEIQSIWITRKSEVFCPLSHGVFDMLGSPGHHSHQWELGSAFFDTIHHPLLQQQPEAVPAEPGGAGHQNKGWHWLRLSLMGTSSKSKRVVLCRKWRWARISVLSLCCAPDNQVLEGPLGCLTHRVRMLGLGIVQVFGGLHFKVSKLQLFSLYWPRGINHAPQLD